MATVDEKRDRIIETGLELFISRGYADSGLKDVSEASGIPKGSLHYYFDNKESLGVAAIERYSARNTALRHHLLLEDRRASPVKRLRAYFTEYARGYEEAGLVGGCLLGNLSAEVADHSEVLRTQLQASFASWQHMVEEVLKEAVARDELPADFPAAQIAQFLVNGWEGALIRMKAEKSARPLKVFIKTIFDHLLQQK